MKTLRFPPVAPLLIGMAVGATACGGIDSGSPKGGGSSNDAGSTNEGGSTDDGGAFSWGAYSDCQWLLTGGTFESSSSPATLTLAPICDASGCSACPWWRASGRVRRRPA